MGFVMILMWIIWTFFSPTRYNHGIAVAFLLPLYPIFYLIAKVLFVLIKMILYPLYALRGKKEQYDQIIEKIVLIFRAY